MARLAAKGFIRTSESHPDEYELYIHDRDDELAQLEAIAKSYMCKPRDDIDAWDDGLPDDEDLPLDEWIRRAFTA